MVVSHVRPLILLRGHPRRIHLCVIIVFGGILYTEASLCFITRYASRIYNVHTTSFILHSPVSLTVHFQSLVVPIYILLVDYFVLFICCVNFHLVSLQSATAQLRLALVGTVQCANPLLIQSRLA